MHPGAALLSLPIRLCWGVSLDECDAGKVRRFGFPSRVEPVRDVVDVGLRDIAPPDEVSH